MLFVTFSSFSFVMFLLVTESNYLSNVKSQEMYANKLSFQVNLINVCFIHNEVDSNASRKFTVSKLNPR